MARASQVQAQGVPPGVPKSYRVLADHGNVPRSTIIVLADDAREKKRPKAKEMFKIARTYEAFLVGLRPRSPSDR